MTGSTATITGKKVLAIAVVCFGIIFAVNFWLAYSAVSTFPGLEVENSYVASQNWDKERAAQLALGWTLKPEYDADREQLRLTFTDRDGLPARITDVAVLVGRPTEAKDDQTPKMQRDEGTFVAPVKLAPGKWMLHVEARAADGTMFRQRIDLFVKVPA